MAWSLRGPDVRCSTPELMAENEDLEVLGSVDSTSPSSADEETDEGGDDEVEEGQHRPIVSGLCERESEFPTPTGASTSTTQTSSASCAPRSASCLPTSARWRSSHR